ncbi:chemotaxis protein CheA [Ideonella margarita]|uniref:Chemotaxis protein CheA n=1 Tax=Ideonella margarita TaxID=2984191 RepID=A0ABU9C4D8_9BURK
MSYQDDDAEIIAAAREGFLEEASDMLRQFEQALLVMETDPKDTENLNAAFRAAHTIKGTAGLFGFTAVVSFTHNVESVMEALRSGQIAASENLTALLLQSRDQMGRLLDEVVSGAADPDVAATSQQLGADLAALLQPASASAAATPVNVTADRDSEVASANAVPADIEPVWHIALRFHVDALRNGLDPLAFIRYLGLVGELRDVRTWCEQVPELLELDAESCHLGFDLRLHTAAQRDTIASVFEFAESDCDIHILAPDASAADYLTMVEACNADDAGRERHRACLEGMGVNLADAPPDADAAATLAVAAQAGTSVATAPAAGPSHEPVEAVALERRETTERRAPDNGRRGTDARFIRVRADKLDRLIDLIGELVIASSGAQLAAQHERAPRVLEATLRIHDLVQEARDGALGLRMVPIGETFTRFQRVVRDVSKALGKDVELQITGGDTELDKSMVETIADPLMHLVRNSLDHGIEPAEERLRAGKPAQGRLALHAYHESGAIMIEVSDDGRGLNRDRILAKAIERGLVGADQHLNDNEIHQLICHPGFSTADQVTDISGRGVGMDVVKRNIEALRGQMLLASEMGHGTTTQIRLPLTLAIIDGFLCEVSGVHYVVPLEMVVECIETPIEYRTDPARVSGYFDLRGDVLPYLDLARYFGRASAHAGRRSLLLVRAGVSTIGLIVDRLEGEHQTVIKPLAPMFKDLPGIAGSTILGSGEVALILDVPALVNQCIRSSHQQRKQADGAYTRD